MLHRLWTDRQGQDLIEYGLLATLVSLAVFAAVLTLGQSIVSFYDTKVAMPW